MATKADYLIRNTVNDATQLCAALEQAGTLAHRITERMLAMTNGGLNVTFLMEWEWPVGYTLNDFVALYTALAALPGSVVSNATRDALYKLISTFQ